MLQRKEVLRRVMAVYRLAPRHSVQSKDGTRRLTRLVLASASWTRCLCKAKSPSAANESEHDGRLVHAKHEYRHNLRVRSLHLREIGTGLGNKQDQKWRRSFTIVYSHVNMSKMSKKT